VPSSCNWILRTKGKCGTNTVMSLQNEGVDVKENRSASRSQVPTETGQTAYKRELAYRSLGINPKDVQCVPFLANQLRRIARIVRGARTEDSAASPVRPLEYLRNSEDPEARKVLKVYYSVPESYRRLLRPEDFCHAAGVSPLRVLESITVVAVRQGAQSSAIVASMLGPRVVAKTVERALQDDGIRGRNLLVPGDLPTRSHPAKSPLGSLQNATRRGGNKGILRLSYLGTGAVHLLGDFIGSMTRQVLTERVTEHSAARLLGSASEALCFLVQLVRN